MSFKDFPNSWPERLGLKRFSLNDRDNLDPSIWIFCSYNLTPSLIHSNDQLISFLVHNGHYLFGFTAIYAFSDYGVRRSLWSKLSEIT